MTHARIMVVAVLAAALAGAGCGDEGGGGGGGGAAEKKPKKSSAKKPDKKKKGANEVISHIPTLEAVVPSAERASIRTRLRDRDFVPDPTGVENRDPFRSYVLPNLELGVATAGATGAAPVQPTERCKKDRMVATDYSYKELSLIGVVQRGTGRSFKRYALFRDRKGVGHIVERGSCVGREKAYAVDIGEALVSFEILHEVPAGAAPAAPTKDTVPLYPNELTADNLGAPDESSDAPPPGATTPTTPAPSVVPPPPSTAPTPPPT